MDIPWLKVGLPLVALYLQGCHTPESVPVAIIGARCNSLTGEACNPWQLPLCSGEVFIPSYLFQAGPQEVAYDHVERHDQEVHVSMSERVFDISQQNALDFGIGFSVPVPWGAFSLSAKYRSLVQQMHQETSMNYYAEISERYILYTVHLSKTPEVKEVRAMVGKLPREPKDDQDFAKWFAFFETYGTHYVKSVAYGGEMRLTLFVEAQVEKDEKVKKANWGFNLRALFQKMIHVNVPFGKDHTKQEFDSFSQYTYQQDFHAIGGDQSNRNYTEWLASVKKNPAPVKTELGLISDFLEISNSEFMMILQSYFTACPSTDLGSCNGYGLCNFQKRRCDCDPELADLDKDGKCYPKCRGNCSGHGQCVKGKCECDFNKDYAMGFWSPPGMRPCSEPCGQKVYDKGTSGALCCPWESNCDLFSGLMGEQEGAPDCFCQKTCPFDKVKGVGEIHSSFYMAPVTYSCMDRKMICGPVAVTCPAYRKITCLHGTGVTCPQARKMNASQLIV